MIIESIILSPPPQCSWCGGFDYTKAEVLTILEAFEKSPIGDPTVVLTYFKEEDERIHVYANHAGVPPLLAGFIYGWGAQEENYQEGSRGI